MLIDEIIKRIHSLTHEQQKDVMEYLKSLQKDGQRRYSRLSTRFRIDAVIDDNKVVQTDTRDISASGVFINTNMQFKTGKSAIVVVSMPKRNSPMRLHGKITRIEKSGMAIKFDNVSPYFEKILDDAIWKSEET